MPLRLAASVQNAIHGIENWRKMDRGAEVADALVARRGRKQARQLVGVRHLELLAISVIYDSAACQPALRLGGVARSLRAKIRHWLQRIERFELRLSNCNAATVSDTA